MKIYNNTNINFKHKKAVVAIGNFDGVHLGHQAVIDLARSAGDAIDAPLGVLTFQPHPREYFQPKAPSFRLMGSQARATRLQRLGVERLYELNFNAAMAALSPREFAQNVICDGLGLRHIVVGADFCFGQARAGTVEDLQAFGREMGFGVTVVPLLEAGQGQVSSTSIRQALSEGRPRDAAEQLGHWHRIEGPVIGGEQRGRRHEPRQAGRRRHHGTRRHICHAQRRAYVHIPSVTEGRG